MRTTIVRCPRCRRREPAEWFSRQSSQLEQFGVFAFAGLFAWILCCGFDTAHLRCLACGHERRPRLVERSLLYRLVFAIALVAVLAALTVLVANAFADSAHAPARPQGRRP